MTYIVVKHDITFNVDILKFIISKKKQIDFPMISIECCSMQLKGNGLVLCYGQYVFGINHNMVGLTSFNREQLKILQSLTLLVT